MASLIQITVVDDPINAILASVSYKSRHLSIAIMDIAEHMSNSIVENVDEGGRPEKWKHLSIYTLVVQLRNSD